MLWLIRWVVNAIALLVMAHYLQGFQVSGFFVALIAALVIGLVNATLGLLVKIVTFPLTIITFGIFLLIVNALMIKVAAALVPGFQVYGFVPALIAGVILSLLNMVLRWSTEKDEED